LARKTLAGLPLGSWIIVIAFGASGILHLVNPGAFLWLMPPFLPFPIELIVVSGVAELAAVALILLKHRFAPALTIAVLLAVWPANWWYAIDTLTTNPDMALAAWIRLPFQLVFIWWAYKTPVKMLNQS
jgi:uncharacterized membrane protein